MHACVFVVLSRFECHVKMHEVQSYEIFIQIFYEYSMLHLHLIPKQC